VTVFVVLTGLMAAAGIALLAWPLLGKRATSDSTSKFAPWPSVVLAGVAVIAAVAGIYPFASNWHWKDAERTAANSASSSDPMIERLEDRLRATPDDMDGWLMLGQSYAARHRYYRSADAFERALELTNGANVEAMLGLGESLALADQGQLTGRAGELLEKVATLAPQNPRALWWGGAAAYQRNNLALARKRWQQFLASNPPPDIAQILIVKISEIDQQIGPASKASTSVKDASGRARVRVRIDVANELNAGEGALFVLARHPGEPGPPLAVKRLAPGPWPMEVELNSADAMMPGRALSAGDEVQVIARISRSGTAAPASGDSYGEVRYHVGRDGLVTLRIDKKVQ
jgi:cytochrome c-type biogenesis protein CcmH